MITDDLLLFFKSFLLGWMVAIPVGPIALLIIQRSLKIGFLAGMATGLGASIADGLCGVLAALGLAALVGQLEESRHFVRPLGSVVLVIVGLHFYFQEPPPLETEEVLTARYLHHYLWDMLSSFFLTLLNPTTIVAFAALFTGSDLIPEDPRRITYFEIASGVFLGSLLWWMVLVVLAQPVKKRLSLIVEHRVLQVIGVVLVLLALISVIPRLGSLIAAVRNLARIYL